MQPILAPGLVLHPLLNGRAIWSGLLSLVMPGLGQIHARSWRRGAILLGATFAVSVTLRVLTLFRPDSPIVAVFVALALGYVLFDLWAVADAMRCVRQTIPVTRPRWFFSTWFAFAAVVALNVGADVALPASGWRNFSIPAGSMSPTILVGDYVVVGIRQAGTWEAGVLPVRGDIVVFKSPRNPAIDFIKRIVGLPGERVQMKQGQLYIDGQVCPLEALGYYETNDAGYVQREKRYRETLPNGVRYEVLKKTSGTDASRRPDFDPAKEFDPNNTIEYVVPPNHVFAIGDHRDNSADSRFINAVGFVPIENLVGRAETLFFSIDTEHPWYEIWYWPFDIRWGRLLQRIH